MAKSLRGLVDLEQSHFLMSYIGDTDFALDVGSMAGGG
jgi:hypothetical protein